MHDTVMVDADAAGYLIRQFRTQGGFTQAQVAHAAGFSATTVSRVERGLYDSQEARCLIAVAVGTLAAMRWPR